MIKRITELEDGQSIQCSIIEITAVPHFATINYDPTIALAEINNSFLQLISETYQLCFSDSLVLEFLFVSESVKDQSLLAHVRLFCIIRKIGVEINSITNEIEVLKSNFIHMLKANNYTVNLIDETNSDNFENLLSNVRTDQVNALIKTEKCPGNMQTPFPYYHCDIMPKANIGFNDLLHALCNEPNSALSFQLIPTSWDENEAYMINQMAASLTQISSGVQNERGSFIKDAMAEVPSKIYTYYSNSFNKPIYRYNILIFGSRNACNVLTPKVISFLQQRVLGVERADFNFVDLSEELLNLKTDLIYYPWNINNNLIYVYRNRELWQQLQTMEALLRMPYLVTAEEATSFFRLPVDDDNIVGLHKNAIQSKHFSFDPSVTRSDSLKFGFIRGMESVSIGCSPKAFTKHALIVGTPGTGKTTFSINILLQFYKRGIPFLVIEPTKTEYRAMIDAVPNLQIFTPGNNDVSPYIINPFIPPKDIRIEQYIPSLASAFKAAFPMPSPLDMIFLSAIRNCYTEYGWKNYSKFGDADVQPFGLYEFILVFKKLVSETNYSSETRGNIQSGGTFRLMNLIEQNSNIYDSINTVPLEDILSKPTILELNAIDNAEQKSLIMALLLINICVYTKHNQVGNGELKNVILIDEAHVLLGGKSSNKSEGADSQGTTIKALQDMIAEIRSFGTSIIIADQSPSKVSSEVIANTDIKIAFRLVQSDEKNIIADSTNMKEHVKQQLSRLETGEAFAYYSMLEDPQLITTVDIREKEGIRLSVSDLEVKERMTYWEERKELLKPHFECVHSQSCKHSCDFFVRANADYYSDKIYREFALKIADKNILIKYMYKLHELVIFYDKRNANKNDLKRLCNCTKIKFLRKILLEKPITLAKEEIRRLLTDTLIKEVD